MQSDKIGEIGLDEDEGSYVAAVEQFLGGQMLHESISVFFIGDDVDYMRRLTNGLGMEGKLEVVGCSETPMEQVMMQINRSNPDVVLFDVGLGVTHHIRTTQLIRNICPQAKLLAIMPDNLALHLRQARWCGAHGWVLKDQPIDSVITKIAEIHECQRYMSTAMADSSS